MRKHLFILFAALITCSINAQTIVCEKQGTTAIQVGEGMAAVAFLSAQSDWVIKPIKGDTELPRTKSSDGSKYVYEFRMDVSKDRERTYIIGRRGSAITDQCVVKSLRPGIRVTYNLEEQADTLQRIEAQLGGSPGVYPVEGKACIEITTSVRGLEVITGWPKQESLSSNGARTINIVVDVNVLKSIVSRRDSLSSVMKKLEDADDYENMASVLNSINETEEEFNKYAELTIGGRGIKGIPIQLTDLSIKEKRRYAVVSISETFENFVSYARELYAAYPSHIESSYYDAARIAYDNAMKHSDCPHDMIATLRAERDTMASIRRTTLLIEKAELAAKKAEAEKGFESQEVYLYLSGELRFIDRLLKCHPEIEGLQPLRMNVISRSQQHPQGKEKDGEETVMHKRETLSGKVSFKNKNTDIPFNRMKVYACPTPKIQDGQSRIIGKVNEDGTYSVVKPVGMEPLYVYVTGEKDNAHHVPAGIQTLDIIIKF